ncbi:hypothetical protein Ahy_B03g062132 isoform C [Arachis hypogaea]|uniref:FAD-binding PCMH-type domain-containing protein n=1 Tax=Arachis hypogaea TaxID=3818 RepID=A0A444ZTF6_ARAHY|nr:hypothetical protein Ahy_B03g062132 isoform C [Arachis hypogaea]
MKYPSPYLTVVVIGLLFSLASSASHTHDHEHFLQCLQLQNSTSISEVVYTPSNSSYSSILHFSIQNHRFLSKTTPKPLVIVTPLHASHVQATIICSQLHGLQIRTRSGGHDFEGVSYISQLPFVIIDLINYRNIEVDAETRTAWVQAGATIVFRVERTLEQNATILIMKWQNVASKLHEDLAIRLELTTKAKFEALFLGGKDKLIPLMQERFPELGLVKEDCTEMSWIESTVYMVGSSSKSLQVLLQRTPSLPQSYKGKSDFLKHPIPESGLEGIWQLFKENGDKFAFMELFPYGGIMDQIPQSKLPFPHRSGNLCLVGYLDSWDQHGRDEVAQKQIKWITRIYSYMEPFASNSPRAAYLNYRDLDIGVNNIGYTSYEQASLWGLKYFKNNFNRLANVKTKMKFCSCENRVAEKFRGEEMQDNSYLDEFMEGTHSFYKNKRNKAKSNTQVPEDN